MSNNKQSSVEWLYNKMYEHRGNITIEEFEQAKAMHKEEIVKAWSNGYVEEWSNGYDAERSSGYSIEYYNETFGGEQ